MGSLVESGTILMEPRGSFLRVGTLKSRFLSEKRASVSCIPWRIQHFGRNCRPWKWHSMDPDQLELGLKFSGLMTSIYVNIQKNPRTSGEVSFNVSSCCFHFVLLPISTSSYSEGYVIILWTSTYLLFCVLCES